MSLRHHEGAHSPGGRKGKKTRQQQKPPDPAEDLKVHLLWAETKRLEQRQKQTRRVDYVDALNGGTTASAVVADSF